MPYTVSMPSLIALLALMIPSASAAPKPKKSPAETAPPAYLVKAAESGDAQAQDRLGWWYDDHGDGKTAVVWYKKAADQGWLSGVHHMGVMLEGGAEGKGAAQDCKASQEYLRKAADAGYAASKFRLGFAYYRGVCVPKDYVQSRLWFERAKTVPGEFFLGLQAEYGLGRPADPAEAAAVYEKVYANLKCREDEDCDVSGKAANQRAHLYYDSTPRDAEKAYLWYLRGVKNADDEDRKRLAGLKASLPPDVRKRLEAEAKER